MTTPDASDLPALQAELLQLGMELAAQSDIAAAARVTRDYVGDRCKRALSKAVVKFLEEGDSATAAEHKARASLTYGVEMGELRKDHLKAEKILSDWEAKKIRMDALRSILSTQKTLAAMQ